MQYNCHMHHSKSIMVMKSIILLNFVKNTFVSSSHAGMGGSPAVYFNMPVFSCYAIFNSMHECILLCGSVQSIGDVLCEHPD